VDYDRGQREARAEVEGVGAVAFPARHRLRVEGSRWQRDWKVSEAAARVLALPRAEARAVDAVLNCWAGRFARRNFPLLIRVRPSSPRSVAFHELKIADDIHQCGCHGCLAWRH
jgi:hypothetical protein